MLVIALIVIHDGWVELQQVRYVVAVAEERSFTRAAQRCFVVQSALSHQVKALETELGVRLFARSSRRVELTDAGERFLPSARAALEAAERAASEATAAAGTLRGTLAVGMIPTVTAIDVPVALHRFHDIHPEVRFTLEVLSSDDQEQAVIEGRLDVGILGLPADHIPRGVASRALLTEQLVAVLPAAHHEAGRTELCLQELAEEQFADFRSGSPGRAQSDQAFSAGGLHRQVVHEATTADLLLELVSHGLAVTLLPAGVVPEDPSLAIIPIADGPRRTQHLAWSDFNPRPTARAFVEMVAKG